MVPVTWARFRPELATQAARDQLTDAEFRLYIDAALWLYATEDMSLRVPAHMLARISAVDEPATVAAGLVKRGWFALAGEGWAIRHDAGVIRSSLIATEAKRERDRKDQAKARAKARARRETSGDESVTDSAAASTPTNYLTTYLKTAPTGDLSPGTEPVCARCWEPTGDGIAKRTRAAFGVVLCSACAKDGGDDGA